MALSWIGAAIGAAASLGGGILGASQAKQESSKQRDWAAQQYGQRYQVTMSDMRQAGLNPMLAYSQGVGTSPTGTAAQIGDYGGAAAGNIIAQGGIRDAQKVQARQQAVLASTVEKKTREEVVTARQNARLAKMKTDDYEKAGDSILSRQIISGARMGATGLKGPKRAGKTEKVGPPKKSRAKRSYKWRFRKKGVTFGRDYKALSFDEALRRMGNR